MFYKVSLMTFDNSVNIVPFTFIPQIVSFFLFFGKYTDDF